MESNITALIHEHQQLQQLKNKLPDDDQHIDTRFYIEQSREYLKKAIRAEQKKLLSRQTGKAIQEFY